MRPLSSASSLLLLALLWSAAAVAQGVMPPAPPMEPLLLEDPVDHTQFEWEVPVSANGLGGYDSDGCTYSRGQQPRHYGVAISPTTGWTAEVADYTPEIPPERLDALRKRLAELPLPGEPSRVPPAARWERAALLAEWLGRDPFAVGDMYLHGAWSVRDSIVGFITGVEGSVDALDKLRQLEPQAQAVENTRGRTIAAFDLARLCHRGGLLVERDRWLKSIDTFPDAGMGAKEKRSAFVARVMEESRLLLQARMHFEAGLAGDDGTPAERARYRFLVGELARRLGDFAEAETHLQAVTLDQAAGKELAQLATDTLEVMKAQERRTAPTGGN